MRLSKIFRKLFLSILFLTSIFINAQGRLLRGVEYEEYDLQGKIADFYVSTIGNDNWSGTISEPNNNNSDGPFATIERAKLAVRELKNEIYTLKKTAIDKRFRGSPHKFGGGRDILVLIREGNYVLDEALIFAPNDGGERVETDLPTGAFEYHKLKDYYITYAAYPGETPIISGGENITGWEKDKNNKWSVYVKNEITELFSNGNRQTLARTPNIGTFGMAEQPTDSAFFKFHSDDIKKWNDMTDNRITITVRWGKYHGQITKVDEKSGLAYLSPTSKDILFVPPKYFIENIEALLDYPGEWFYNKKNRKLSYIPEDDNINPNDAFIVSPNLSNLIYLSGKRELPVRNLRFYNLTFTNTKTGGNATILFEYSKNCELLKNNIQNVSQTAIALGLGCYHNIIKDNFINDVKGNGITVMGNPQPEDWKDVVSDNLVIYNSVTNLRPAHVGIATKNALRTNISSNYVSNTGSYGITAGDWPNVEENSDGNHLVENNHVSFTNMVRDDEGGIAVYGLSPGSVVRNNLIHDVHAAATNENVGFFFQNMASGWTVTDNIYYNLKQGEMKLCAAYLINNLYEDNFIVETPTTEPEKIIFSKPEFSYSDLKVNAENGFTTGNTINITAKLKNNGGSGIKSVNLYIDSKLVDSQKFAVLSNNSRTINFDYQFFDPGKHTVAIGKTDYANVNIKGEPQYLLYSDLYAPILEVALGTDIPISVKIKNVRPEKRSHKIDLIVNDKITASKEIVFEAGETKNVAFNFKLGIGSHNVSIGSHQPINIMIYGHKKFNIKSADFFTFCSGTAEPCEFEYTVEDNYFGITACGTDFLHAEDSYGTIFLEKVISGNFVATVKLIEFGDGVSEWFRAGIFVRNDLTKSNETEKGSLGSFLMFSTPKRGGAEWDEFGDGNMHNTKSRNYNIDNPFPVWLKLVRHGNKFTGYYSFDGNKWIFARESEAIPGLSKYMDIGLAAGTNDQKPSKVIFEDFKLWIEK